MATVCVLTAVVLRNSIKRTVVLLQISVFTRTCALFFSLSSRDPWQAQIYKSANVQFFSHYESANKLPRKRNIDRYREPQQRFTKPQTELYTIRRQALCTVYHSY